LFDAAKLLNIAGGEISKKGLAGLQEGARSGWPSEPECQSKYSEKTAFLLLDERIKLFC
jgi:hypothetical protein